MNKEIKKYQMKYISGGGTEYDGGEWDIKETPKMYIFKCIKQSFFESGCPEIMRIKKDNTGRHCLRDWDDGDFTVYPFQSGVPHLFNQLK